MILWEFIVSLVINISLSCVSKFIDGSQVGCEFCQQKQEQSGIWNTAKQSLKDLFKTLGSNHNQQYLKLF